MFYGKLVKVQWSDPVTIGGKWVPLKDIIDSRPMAIVTYGKVVYEDEHLINIASSFTDDGDADGDLSLPKCMINTITELEENIIHTFNHQPVTSISTTIPSEFPRRETQDQ
jgi:hypothetical protein